MIFASDIPSVIPFWLFDAGVGIFLLSFTMGLLVFQNERSRGPFVATFSTVGASFLVLAIFTVPLGLTVSDYLFWVFDYDLVHTLAPLGALLASAVGQLIYLERNQKPRRTVFYWYCLAAFLFGELILNPIPFAVFSNSVWVTIALVFAFFVYRRRLSRQLYWVLIGSCVGADIVFAVPGTIPGPYGFLLTYLGVFVWWMGCLFKTETRPARQHEQDCSASICSANVRSNCFRWDRIRDRSGTGE